ncbi:MAG: type II secretion system F family protein [Minisyncoccia bacterium]
MKFKYQARTKEGELQAGFVEAGDRDAALQVLANHNLFVLSVAATEKKSWYDPLTSFINRVRRRDLVIFARQLATLLEARLPLSNALVTLKGQTTNETLKEALAQISQDINSGLSFSQALEHQGEIFPTYYTAMIRASEVTGNLNEAATFLADYTEREGVLASKAASALIYPGILLGLFLVVGFILLTFVFPQIEPIFQESNISIPWYTAIFLGLGTFLQKWWPAVIIGVIFVSVIVVDYFRSSEGRALLDEGEVNLPILQKVYLPLLMARFSNAMELLIHGQIPIAQSLEIMATMMDSASYAEIIQSVAADVRQGQLLSESLAQYPKYFPTLVSQMIGVGETTGKTEEMFGRIASIYTRDANQVMDNLIDVIQPVLLIGMGLLVGLLFASILIPLYSLTASI